MLNSDNNNTTAASAVGTADTFSPTTGDSSVDTAIIHRSRAAARAPVPDAVRAAAPDAAVAATEVAADAKYEATKAPSAPKSAEGHSPKLTVLPFGATGCYPNLDGDFGLPSLDAGHKHEIPATGSNDALGEIERRVVNQTNSSLDATAGSSHSDQDDTSI